MKKKFFSIMAVGITAIMLNSAKAQVAMNTSSKSYAAFTTTGNDYSVANITADDIGFRALKDFKTRFAAKEAITAAWYKTDNGYMVKFAVNSISTVAAYKKNGNWIYTIYRYDEKKLPVSVRALVKSTYYDYTILHVDEVNMPQYAPVYILLLRDNEKLKIIRVHAGEMETMHDYHE